MTICKSKIPSEHEFCSPELNPCHTSKFICAEFNVNEGNPSVFTALDAALVKFDVWQRSTGLFVWDEPARSAGLARLMPCFLWNFRCVEGGLARLPRTRLEQQESRKASNAWADPVRVLLTSYKQALRLYWRMTDDSFSTNRKTRHAMYFQFWRSSWCGHFPIGPCLDWSSPFVSLPSYALCACPLFITPSATRFKVSVFLCFFLQAFYYFAMVEDLIFRLLWTLTVSVGQLEIFHSELLKLILSMCEVFR